MRPRVVLYLATAKPITIYFTELNKYYNRQYSVWVVILSYASLGCKTYHALYCGHTSTILGSRDQHMYARAISYPAILSPCRDIRLPACAACEGLVRLYWEDQQQVQPEFSPHSQGMLLMLFIHVDQLASSKIEYRFMRLKN